MKKKKKKCILIKVVETTYQSKTKQIEEKKVFIKQLLPYNLLQLGG